MAAIVNKALTASTARSAFLAQAVVSQWARDRGVGLNYGAGGLNVHAVRNATQYSDVSKEA